MKKLKLPKILTKKRKQILQTKELLKLAKKQEGEKKGSMKPKQGS